MTSQGIKASPVTYSSLARGFAKQGNYQRVEEITSQMKADGFPMNEYMLCVILTAYANSQPKQAQRAEHAFRAAVSAQIPMDEFILTSLDRALGRQAADTLLWELGVRRVAKGSGRS